MEDLNLTKRSIGQVIFRHTPGSLIALDEWGVYGVVSLIKGNPDTNVDKNLLYKKVRWFASKWKDESDGRIKGFEIDTMQPETLVAIHPEGQVVWDFIQQMLLECTNPKCKIIVNIADSQFSGKCPRCHSSLKQFKYVWFHNCGILRPFLPILQVNCPIHGRKYLYLNDTGRFRSSTWRCRECNYERALGMLPCTDEICRRKKGDSPYLRASVWNDPWVYFTQVVTFINIKENQLRPVIESEYKEELLLSSYSGTLKAGNNILIEKATNEISGHNCIKCGTALKKDDRFCSNCGEPQPISKQVEKSKQQRLLPEALLNEDSELASFAILRDLQRTISLRDQKNMIEANQDLEKANSLKLSLESLNNIGVFDVFMINDFPLTYAAIGYSRFQSRPPTWLRAFPPISTYETKIPIYTNCITTEAWMIQLSAKYILNWLNKNKYLEGLPSKPNVEKMNEVDSKIYLLSLLSDQTNGDSILTLQITVKELIHTLSHIYLQALAIESGLDIASFGELLLSNALTFILYAGESDIGGLSATFSQGLNQVVDLVNEQFRSCKFDPSCSEDDDGSCVGCLHIPRGCVEFNEKLSRAYIFGGKTKKLSQKIIDIGFFDLQD